MHHRHRQPLPSTSTGFIGPDLDALRKQLGDDGMREWIAEVNKQYRQWVEVSHVSWHNDYFFVFVRGDYHTYHLQELVKQNEELKERKRALEDKSSYVPVSSRTRYFRPQKRTGYRPCR